MFQEFPYTNFHQLNLDWIVKIAKDFLDQYTHIQEVIQTGLDDLAESRETGLAELDQKRIDSLAELIQKTLDGLADLQTKYDTLEGLLQAWYDTHSADIAGQLADAIIDFNAAAEAKSQALLDSWPADYSELVTEYDELKTALNTVAENHKNLAIPDFDAKTMTINDGSGTVFVSSNDFNVESGHTYFVYAKVKITDLASWTSGYMYTRLIFDVNAGYVGNISAIANNGEYVMSGNITPNATGSVKVQIFCNYQNPSSNEFTVTLEKLFVVESSNDLKVLCEHTEQEEYLVEKINIPYKTIDPDMLKDSVLSGIQTDIENIEDDIGDIEDGITIIESDIEKIADIKRNILTPETDAKTVNIADGTASVFVSDTQNVESGKTYFVYCKFKITSLVSWTAGLIYLRLLFSIDAGGWSQSYISSIANNGEYELYYNVTPSNSGEIKAQLYFNQQNPSTNSFNVTVEKLFLVESSENLKSICQETEQGNGLLEKINIPDGNVTFNNLNSDVQKAIPYSDDKVIDCWGDSLTAGIGSTDGNTYPKYLKDFLGNDYSVTNYGHGGETAVAIAFRQGALGIEVEPFSVANNDRATIDFTANNGMSLRTLFSNAYGTEGIDHINILVDDANCSLMFRTTETPDEGTVFNYTGNALSFSRPVLATSDGAKNKNRTLIICIGQNGFGYGLPAKDHINEMIDLIWSMIKHDGGNRYIIISPPTNNAEFWQDYEAALGSAFGQNYLNVRKYISAYGLDDNNLTPTAEDEAAMAIGAIPPQLLNNDPVHFTNAGYYSFAKCIYQRGQQIGYW